MSTSEQKFTGSQQGNPEQPPHQKPTGRGYKEVAFSRTSSYILPDPDTLREDLHNSPNFKSSGDNQKDIQAFLSLKYGQEKASSLMKENNSFGASEGSETKDQKETKRNELLAFQESKSTEHLKKLQEAKDSIDQAYDAAYKKFSEIAKKYPQSIPPVFFVDLKMKHVVCQNKLSIMCVRIDFDREISANLLKSLDVDKTSLETFEFLYTSQVKISDDLDQKFVKLERELTNLSEVISAVPSADIETSEEDIRQARNNFSMSALGMGRENVAVSEEINKQPDRHLFEEDYYGNLNEIVLDLEDGISTFKENDFNKLEVLPDEAFSHCMSTLRDARLLGEIGSKDGKSEELRTMFDFENKMSTFRKLLVEKLNSIAKNAASKQKWETVRVTALQLESIGDQESAQMYMDLVKKSG